MKRHNIILTILSGSLLLFGGCNDFLDTVPDNRTELDTDSKIASVLVSAYPTYLPVAIAEISSDNVMDNGSLYDPYFSDIEPVIYRWEVMTNTSWDDPTDIWNDCYSAVAAANQALEAIEKQGNPAALDPQRGEALLCRAYGHFVLVNLFCQHYNAESSTTDMGIPYSTAPETKVLVQYSRGTVAETYEKIDKDIETGLPLIDDNAYSVPKYHFNRQAAYAFAARFNLFYRKFDKVIEYATAALGENPDKLLLNYEEFKAGLTGGAAQITNEFPSATTPRNFLIVPINSMWGRLYNNSIRYGHGRAVCENQTIWAKAPWGSSSNLVLGNLLYGSDRNIRFPKCNEFFEYTDKAAGIGHPHVVTVPFSAEETLLCRAEAYIYQKDFDRATEDLASWMKNHCYSATPLLTRKKINDFFTGMAYTTPENPGIKNELHPKGFTVEAGEQENFIHCVLHFRRIETIHEGQRWYDIKRYGIVVNHNLDGENTLVLQSEDNRRAIQLPADVINAGLPANPR